MMFLKFGLVKVKAGARRRRGGVPGAVPSHVLWVVLQTGDEVLHISAVEADLADRREQRKPEEPD